MKLCPACDRHLFGSEPTCPFCGEAQASTAARQPASALASLTLALTLGTVACGPLVDPQESNDSSGSVDDATTGSPISTTAMTTVPPPVTDDGPSMTTGDEASMTTIELGSSSGDGSDDNPCAFYAGCPPDVDTGPYECDLFAQDCPVGEKCMPWANDGGNEWNATRCSPATDAPEAPGEPCTVEGGPYSGLDSCGVGVMCIHVDPRTNEGTCVVMCSGSEASPQCAAPEQICVYVAELIPLCALSCQPLQPECPEGEGCYPAEGQFACWTPTDAPGDQGDACEYVNGCIPELVCVDGSTIPDCPAGGCCTEYCDLAAGLPCPGADQGVTCVPWYDDGMAPPGDETVGYCAVP